MYTFQTSDIWDMSIFGCMHKNIYFLQQPQFFNDQWNQRAEINNEKKLWRRVKSTLLLPNRQSPKNLDKFL